MSATALALVLAGPAQAAATGWRVVFSHHYGAAKHICAYDAVIAPGARDAWAFGGSDISGPTIWADGQIP